MDQLLALMQGGESTQAVLLVVIFSIVVLLVFAGGAMIVEQRGRVERRLGEIGAKSKKDAAGPSLRYGDKNNIVSTFLHPFRRAAGVSESYEGASVLRRRLLRAGYSNPGAVGTYYAARIALALLLPGAALLVAPWAIANITAEKLLAMVLALVFIGFYFPMVWVMRRTNLRQRMAREGFPDALDMLLVCVEAGLGLDASLKRVGMEIGRAHPVLGQEFQMTALETQAGKKREEALRNFADRLGVEEVSSLVTLLVQSEMLGTSIAQSLRVHAEDMRRTRLVKAEEKANKLPVEMAIPLVLFIFPALFMTIMIPVIIRLLRVLGPAMTF